MNDTHDFMPAILANPADDTPRLIYADWLRDRDEWTWDNVLAHVLAHPEADGPRLLAASWLEENGEPERAEFIRLQIDIAQAQQAIEILSRDQFLILPESPRGERIEAIRSVIWQMRQRERELLDARRAAWCRPIWETVRKPFLLLDDEAFEPSAHLVGIGFSRGFVSSITCTAADWLAHADALTAAQPIERVELTTRPGTVQLWDHQWRRVNPASIIGSLIVELLGAEWPGVTFTLPARGEDMSQLNSLLRQIRDQASEAMPGVPVSVVRPWTPLARVRQTPRPRRDTGQLMPSIRPR